MDGLFTLDKFIMPNFNSEEVELIYKNIKISNNEEEITNVILEVKLNKKKLSELIDQIKYDYSIMKKIVKNKIILLGFVVTGDIDRDIDLPGELGHLNCVIFEIKGDFVLGKRIKQYIDWNTVEDLEIIKNDVEELKNNVEEIKNGLEEVKLSICELKDNFNKLIHSLNNKENSKNEKKMTMIGKKTRRGKK